jgi:hypothetical protein
VCSAIDGIAVDKFTCLGRPVVQKSGDCKYFELSRSAFLVVASRASVGRKRQCETAKFYRHLVKIKDNSRRFYRNYELKVFVLTTKRHDRLALAKMKHSPSIVVRPQMKRAGKCYLTLNQPLHSQFLAS